MAQGTGRGELLSIWFFVGVMTLSYGIVLFPYGAWEWFGGHEPGTVLHELHRTFWWGLLLFVFGTIGSQTPVWLIVLQAFCYGAFTSLQYTSMNTLVYADVTDQQESAASSIASTMQQMSISFGVATASLATAFFNPDRFHTNAPQMIQGIHKALVGLGILTIASTIVFRSLKSGDGDDVSQHKVLHPGG